MGSKIYEIKENFFMIRSEEPDFHRNIYVRKFTDGIKTVNMIFDPGTKLDIPLLIDSLKDLIGGVHNIDIIFISHQDPDVSSNVTTLINSAPKAIVLGSIDTWRLVKMYGIPEKRYYSIEDFKGDTILIKRTGHKIKFVPARYCHFRGSMMLYDIEAGILFTGDFLGGLNTKKNREDIYANEESWEGISIFHQIYMPSSEAVRETINTIGKLDPIPEIIAPHHGDVIKGQFIAEFLHRLSKMEVGVDVLLKRKPEMENVTVALNEFLQYMKENHAFHYPQFMEKLKNPGEFTLPFVFKEDLITETKLSSEETITYLYNTLKEAMPESVFQDVKTALINFLEKYNINIPEVLIDYETLSDDLFQISND